MIQVQEMSASVTRAWPGAELELLTVKLLDEGAGYYYEVETDGWSFNDVSDLSGILELLKPFAKDVGASVTEEGT